MKINIPAALALLLTTAPLHAKPLSLLHWCSDGTAIHLREDNGRLTITWRGASFPVDKIQTGNLTVDMTGSTPNQSTVMLLAAFNDTPTPTTTITANVVGRGMMSATCRPDTGAKHIDL
ncbi:TPA: hypothetical protein P6524_004888 [Escherichia coli]|nr:Uncharacterised protein [Enterobacter cloacae]HDP7620214.1 hypothetical protein [Escherichia coli]